MTEARPIEGDDPYEKLGVERTMTREEILDAANTLKSKKDLEIKQRKGAGDEEGYKEATDAVLEIKDAISWIEGNHPAEGHPEPTTLSLDVGAPKPTVDDTVEFKVTSSDGPESGIDVESDRGHSTVTGSNGTASMAFDTAGNVEVRTSGGMNYHDDSATLDVQPRHIDLDIVGMPTELAVRQRERLRVTDSSGTGVEAITVLADGDQVGRTDADGYVELQFDSTGTRIIQANANDTISVTYAPATAEVDVVEEQIPLRLQVATNQIRVGEETTFRVVDDADTGVRDAVVEAAGGPTGSTDGDGETTLTFQHPGSFEVTVSKQTDAADVNYVEQTADLHVHRGDASLAVGQTRGTFEEGGEVEIQITDTSDTGVADATVTTNHGHQATTDADGWVSLTIQREDDLELTAEKSSDRFEFSPVETTFTVSEHQPELSMADVPQVASPGDQVSVKVVDENGTPVSGAVIHSARRPETWETGEDGVATVDLMDRTGIETLTADKPSLSVKEQAEQRILLQ
ncbi:hypothetical protein ACFQGE_14060 [Halomicroarcula sp. GCM10025817]|uniref:hypothetical protein n=2 Tax=Haloarcula TaxID=2237 RepID=UPI003606F47B